MQLLSCALYLAFFFFLNMLSLFTFTFACFVAPKFGIISLILVFEFIREMSFSGEASC
jgi:apolipoprotein N-acyltransferase